MLVNDIRKTYCKLTIENYINISKVNIIISIIKNLRAENTSYTKDFLLIYHCQIVKYDYLNKNNIKNIKQDIIALW